MSLPLLLVMRAADRGISLRGARAEIIRFPKVKSVDAAASGEQQARESDLIGLKAPHIDVGFAGASHGIGSRIGHVHLAA